jgi:hypothetical protein
VLNLGSVFGVVMFYVFFFFVRREERRGEVYKGRKTKAHEGIKNGGDWIGEEIQLLII